MSDRSNIRCPKCSTNHADDSPPPNHAKHDAAFQVFCTEATASRCSQCHAVPDKLVALVCGHLVCSHHVSDDYCAEKLCTKCAAADAGIADKIMKHTLLCSHGARPIRLTTGTAETCCVCLEEFGADDAKDNRMIALTCGHMVCQQDFVRLGGGVAVLALLDEVVMNWMLRLLYDESTTADAVQKLFWTILGIFRSSEESSSSSSSSSSSGADEARSWSNLEAFQRAGGPAAVAQAFARFPSSVEVLSLGCLVLYHICDQNELPCAVKRQFTRSVLDTPGILDTCLRMVEFNQGCYAIAAACRLLEDLFIYNKAKDAKQLTCMLRLLLATMEKQHEHPDLLARVLGLLESLLLLRNQDVCGSGGSYQLFLQLQVPEMILNVMSRYPDDMFLQAKGIGALCFASLGLDMMAQLIAQNGGIEATCQARQRYTNVRGVQYHGCYILWTMANCPSDMVQKTLLGNHALQRINEAAVLFPENRKIRSAACSTLSNFTKMMPLEIARAGCIVSIANSVMKLDDLDFDDALPLVRLFHKLSSSKEKEVRLALRTSDARPALLKLVNACFDSWYASTREEVQSTYSRVLEIYELVRDSCNMLGEPFPVGREADNGNSNGDEASSVIGGGVEGEVYSDSDEDDESVASSTFGEDLLTVFREQIIDSYGDPGHYTGVILRSTGMPHGSGRMVYHGDKGIFDGEWRHGRWHGPGRATFASGDHFVGEYRLGQPDGRGRYEWNDRPVYHEAFAGDERQGR